MQKVKIESLEFLYNNLQITNLPLFYESNFKYNININEKDFIFVYKWNNTMEFWSLNIYDQYNVFLTSVKIVPDWNLYNNMQYRTDLQTLTLLSYNISNSSKYPDQFSLSEEHTISVSNIIFE